MTLAGPSPLAALARTLQFEIRSGALNIRLTNGLPGSCCSSAVVMPPLFISDVVLGLSTDALAWPINCRRIPAAERLADILTVT